MKIEEYKYLTSELNEFNKFVKKAIDLIDYNRTIKGILDWQQRNTLLNTTIDKPLKSNTKKFKGMNCPNCKSELQESNKLAQGVKECLSCKTRFFILITSNFK